MTTVVGAGLLGMLLLSAGLYVWRRPQPENDVGARQAQHDALISGSVEGDGGLAAPTRPALPASSPVEVSEVRVLGCHDPGSKKTRPDECDHLTAIERALSEAIEQSAGCMPARDGGATIEYVADVSFSRGSVRISLPRGGRSIRDASVLGACAAAVRGAVDRVALDGVVHRHARYHIAVTATYRRSG